MLRESMITIICDWCCRIAVLQASRRRRCMWRTLSRHYCFESTRRRCWTTSKSAIHLQTTLCRSMSRYVDVDVITIYWCNLQKIHSSKVKIVLHDATKDFMQTRNGTIEIVDRVNVAFVQKVRSMLILTYEHLYCSMSIERSIIIGKYWYTDQLYNYRRSYSTIATCDGKS
jgi:hypothetical protein